MRDIVHPIGMSMLSRTISKTDLDEDIITEGVIHTIGGNPVGSRISVSNSYGVVVTGLGGTLFANTSYANVGDMLLLKDVVLTGRSQAKMIVAIDSNTSLNVESNFIFIGQGKLSTNATNTHVIIAGNTKPVGNFVAVDDILRINVNNVVITRSVSGISGVELTLNTAISTTNSNIVYQVVPDYASATYEYSIIRITE